MSRAALAYGLAALAWAAVVIEWPSLRAGHRSSSRRTLWLILLSVAMSLTVRLPPVYLALDAVMPQPRVAEFLQHGLILVAIGLVQEFLLQINSSGSEPRPRVTLHRWLVPTALAAMGTFFLLAPIEVGAADFWEQYAGAPFVTEYRLVFLGSLAAGLVSLVRVVRRYACRSRRPAVFIGLRAGVLGGLVGLGYVTHEAAYVIGRRLDDGFAYPFGDPTFVRSLLIAGSLGPLLVGATMPLWGDRVGITVLHRWIAGYVAHRRLYPLWRIVVRAIPEVALLPPRSALSDALDLRHLGLRRYRRAIEVLDARLALRPYLAEGAVRHASDLCRQAGIVADEAQAVMEAACLAAAVRAKALGVRAAQPIPFCELPFEDDEGRQTAFLARVAHCYHRSPIVCAVLDRLEREAAHHYRPRAQGARPAGQVR